MAGDEVAIEVAFATPEKQIVVPLTIAAGITARDAVRQSRIAKKFPETDFESLQLGIWGHTVADDHVVADGDRVEIYRPLAIDPRDARRELALQGKVMGQADD